MMSVFSFYMFCSYWDYIILAWWTCSPTRQEFPLDWYFFFAESLYCLLVLYSERIEYDLVWLTIERSHHHFDWCSTNSYYNHLFVDFLKFFFFKKPFICRVNVQLYKGGYQEKKLYIIQEIGSPVIVNI